MVTRHKVKIGEIKDPDVVDSRDCEEEEEDEDQNGQERAQHEQSSRKSKSSTKKVTIELSGKIAEAIAGIRSVCQQTKDVEVVKYCVLRVWGELQAPEVRQAEELVNSVVTEVRYGSSILLAEVSSLESKNEDDCLGGPRLIPYVIPDSSKSDAAGVSSTA
jgi:hypothetical protein